jgi:uncharacterized membrane protein YgaE (UPF0421/DUF939 family)
VISEASTVQGTAWPILVHSLRTAIACVASLLVARLFRLPEAYWAPITTVVITQSSLGAALTVSWHRFLGTALGALVGAAVATYFGPHAVAFGIGVFVLGLIRIVMHSDLAGYRFGGVALAIVLLVPRTGPAWPVAFHRFIEVSIGIGVALMFSVVWPEKEAGTGYAASHGSPAPEAVTPTPRTASIRHEHERGHRG